ncbi:Choline transport protein [Colletotrichum aenigma]|uniref:Choline transport protein n=1 Tax=Colletotrichum aenigma TaxID=1215731 RepID=UPI001872D996|nr:Choline transport protein [Colletotrichum aenigma]KAF5520931.1 Choline transport protein [Colletotrichum aenigma]
MDTKFDMDVNETKTGEPLRTIDSTADNVNAISDEDRLAQLGHAQELKRQFSLPTLGALCLCLMATWEALSTVVAQALLSGGAPCLFYNYVLSFVCSVCIAASLGEIASIYPTAGGQYHWVAALCPPKTRSLAAFTTGWISVGGLTVFCASAAFAAGLQTQALIILNDDSYVPQRWQGMLFYWAVLLYSSALNIWGSKMLPHANMISGVIHVVAFIAILIVLGVMASKNTSSFVFTEFVNSSGWTNDGVSWLVGLISAVYPFLGYDAACHMAEEIPNATRNVPIAMVGSVVANGLMGLVYVVVLLFSTGSLETLLATPTGFPFMQIYLDTTKSRAGATVISLTLITVAVAATVGCITSTSRTLWAFARDKAVPFDAFFSHVHKDLQVPVRAIAVVTIMQLLLGFLYLGNTTAFNAVLSMAIIGIYLSYSIPIAYMLLVGRNRLTRKEYGPFRLWGFLGPVLNVVSLVWMTVVIIFSTFPSAQPVTAQNMNYSTVVMAGWVVSGLCYYFARGHAKFEVPVVISEVVEGVGDI